MFIHPIETAGLAALSYVVGDGGQAVVIDPRRDVEAYLDFARDRGLHLTHAIETHRHEDFVSGAREIAARTGATILHGRGPAFDYGDDFEAGQILSLGDVRLTCLRTPGHTDESISVVLRHEQTGDSPLAVFTGDALFVGDVGRTDFHPERRREDAEALYQSLHEALLPLGDQCVVYPAHGAGSVCGDGMADRNFSTIGYERLHNPLLQLSRGEFIERKASEEHARPPYFERMERVNRVGPPVVGPLRLARPIDAETVATRIDARAPVIDVRAPQAFAGSHVPGSINIPLEMLPAYAGWLITDGVELTLIAERPADVQRARVHLRRLGLELTGDYLGGGVTAWETSGRPLGQVPIMPAAMLRQRLGEVQLIDVRTHGEWSAGHLPTSEHLFLGDLPNALEQIGPLRPVVTFCGSGRRAMIAASVLRAHGVDEVHSCFGSMMAWQAIDGPVERLAELE